jgi:hypothetical protein
MTGKASTVGNISMKAKMRLQGRQRQASERCQYVETAQAFASTTVVHQMDVLFGFDPEISNDHIGNIQFYHLVEYNKSICQALPKRKGILVARSIVDTIIRSGGRFLHQESICIGNKNFTHWIEMSNGEAILKTMNALSESNRSIVFVPLARLMNYEMNDAHPVHSVNKSHVNDPVTKEKEQKSSNFWRSLQDTIREPGYESAVVSPGIGSKSKVATALKGKDATVLSPECQSRSRYQGSTYADKDDARSLVLSEILSSSSTEKTSESACRVHGPECSKHDRATRSNIWVFGSAQVVSLQHGLKTVSRVARRHLRSKRLHPIVKMHEAGSSTVLSGSW